MKNQEKAITAREWREINTKISDLERRINILNRMYADECKIFFTIKSPNTNIELLYNITKDYIDNHYTGTYSNFEKFVMLIVDSIRIEGHGPTGDFEVTLDPTKFMLFPYPQEKD